MPFVDCMFEILLFETERPGMFKFGDCDGGGGGGGGGGDLPPKKEPIVDVDLFAFFVIPGLPPVASLFELESLLECDCESPVLTLAFDLRRKSFRNEGILEKG